MKKYYLKADLHIHSDCSSDGMMSIEQIIDISKKAGLDVIAITDHNRINKRIMRCKTKLLIIPGIEVSCEQGHVIGLGVNKIIKKGMDIEETVNKIHSLGGIAIAAHPCDSLRQKIDENGIAACDAIEVLNSRSFSWSNKKAYNIAMELKKPMVSGSDAHLLEEIGRFACKVHCDRRVNSILRSIKDGHTLIPKSQTTFFQVIASKLKHRIKML